jgi:hypothetical protein
MTERTPDKVGAFDASSLLRPTAYDPAMKRPTSTTAGAALVVLRALAGVFVLVLLAGQFSSFGKELAENVDGLSSAEASSGLLFFAAVTGVLVLIDLVLAVFIYRGHNWPRVIVMSIAVVSITSSFIAWWWQGEEISLGGSAPLLSLGLDILVLLALSSRSAATYARRNQRP